MAHFSSDGVDIAYEAIGEGEEILLIHGFGSSISVNWRATGWIDTLTGDGRRVIAMDVRGNGESAKLYDPAQYRPTVLARDAANLLDHLSVSRADVMGYSMGARIATMLALDYPAKVRSLVIGGMGSGLTGGLGDEDAIAAALEAPREVTAPDPAIAIYRTFANRTRSDLRALAACIRGNREPIPPERLTAIRLPVLVAVGTKDDRVGTAAGLAEMLPNARVLDIVGRDHMLATGDRQFKSGVLAFLHERP